MNAQNKDGWTPLMFALRNESGTVTVEVINKILDLNPDVNVRNKDGRSPLMIAFRNESGKVTVEVMNKIMNLA